MNDEQIWYLYQNATQMGPFDAKQILNLHHTNMIAHDSYVFKVGWKDWRPVEEGLEELGIKLGSAVSEESLTHRRKNAPRATINGRVVIHNGGQISVGKGANISPSGIFVETDEKVFKVGESLKLSVRCDGISKPFNVSASVIRFNSDSRYPIGYGLRFGDLDAKVCSEIERLIQEQDKQKRA